MMYLPCFVHSNKFANKMGGIIFQRFNIAKEFVFSFEFVQPITNALFTLCTVPFLQGYLQLLLSHTVVNVDRLKSDCILFRYVHQCLLYLSVLHEMYNYFLQLKKEEQTHCKTLPTLGEFL